MTRIEDHALIGDCRSAALVDRDGTIDWLCLPRFDSPACFAALLGTPDNGHWRITPAGPVTDEFYDHFTDALATGCKLARADGVLLALHGAMVTPKHPDADAETLRRVRAALGPKVPLAVSLDFHGNISPQMAQTANVLVGYQTYPHVDQRERGLLAARLLVRAVNGEVHPVA